MYRVRQADSVVCVGAKLYREFRRVLKPGGLLAFYDVVSINGPAAPRYPLPWSETSATSFLLTREATLEAVGASGFVMQAERDVSQEALGWFQRTIGAAPQGPNLSVVMGPRMAVMAPNLARSVRERGLALLMGRARAI
jgi:SAM-dependent methyltransferase